MKRSDELVIEKPGGIDLSGSRRNFLKYTGGAAVLGSLFLVGCDDDDPVPPSNGGVNLGSGDIGILNYAYALEQLEAAYYMKVEANFSNSNLSSAEKKVLEDIRKHEEAHADFYKAALGGDAIGALEVDFSAVDFTDRTSILETARTFEDLGVAAYNGAGKLLSDVQFLVVAGKIVSVEARHASAIRDLISPGTTSFAGDDVIDAKGLERAFSPSQVLAAAGPFIVTKIDASNLPS